MFKTESKQIQPTMRDLRNSYSLKKDLVTLLVKYYNGDLNKLEENIWQDLVEALQNEIPEVATTLHQGLEQIKNAKEEDFSRLEFDFNKLFTGPAKLLAPPYKSSYCNEYQVFMQKETLEVRRFYADLGLTLKAKNNMPDDYIVYLLEFVNLVLAKLMSEGNTEEYLNIYNEFVEKHLQSWCEKHTKDIFKNTENQVCYGMANILIGYLEVEKY